MNRKTLFLIPISNPFFIHCHYSDVHKENTTEKASTSRKYQGNIIITLGQGLIYNDT